MLKLRVDVLFETGKEWVGDVVGDYAANPLEAHERVLAGPDLTNGHRLRLRSRPGLCASKRFSSSGY